MSLSITLMLSLYFRLSEAYFITVNAMEKSFSTNIKKFHNSFRNLIINIIMWITQGYPHKHISLVYFGVLL